MSRPKRWVGFDLEGYWIDEVKWPPYAIWFGDLADAYAWKNLPEQPPFHCTLDLPFSEHLIPEVRPEEMWLFELVDEGHLQYRHHWAGWQGRIRP